jgi:NADPH2:quinone reductase
LVQAAAGGVGLILTQWAKHLGATVIGTVGSPEKVELARHNGCDHVINYRTEDFAARVKELTDGKGCHVVYDGVGKATFPGSLDCLRPLGYLRCLWRVVGADPAG